MQSLIHEGHLYRDHHQRYCLETTGALAYKRGLKERKEKKRQGPAKIE
jgi:hypothetical protein